MPAEPGPADGGAPPPGTPADPLPCRVAIEGACGTGRVDGSGAEPLSGPEPPTLGALGVGTGGVLGGAVGVGIDGGFGAVCGASELTGDGLSDESSVLCSTVPDRGARQSPTSIVLVAGSGFAEL